MPTDETKKKKTGQKNTQPSNSDDEEKPNEWRQKSEWFANVCVCEWVYVLENNDSDDSETSQTRNGTRNGAAEESGTQMFACAQEERAHK